MKDRTFDGILRDAKGGPDLVVCVWGDGEIGAMLFGEEQTMNIKIHNMRT